MSYILDALKKAEADRDPDARASLAMAQHERRRNRWLIYAVVIALIANAAILLWLFLPDERPDAPAAESTGQTTNLAPVQTPQVRPPQPALPASRGPGAADRVIEAPEPRPTRPATITAESATGETIIRPGAAAPPRSETVPVSSLPSAQRARFPNLSFSTHVYADDADLRAIVVNGTRLEEGDRLGNLRLAEITEDGAVFRFENRLVSVSVLDEWN